MSYDPNIQNGDVGDTYPAIEEDIPAPSASGGLGAAAGTGLAIGAGLGILSSIGQQNARQAQAKAAATQTRFSPWSHLGGGAVPAQVNTLGNIAGLGAAGATLGQGLAGNSLTPRYGGGQYGY